MGSSVFFFGGGLIELISESLSRQNESDLLFAFISSSIF